MSERIKEVCKAIHDYYREHNRNPLRITVSHEVARDIEAEHAARFERYDSEKAIHLQLLSMGGVIYIKGIPIVADLEDSQTVDIRS